MGDPPQGSLHLLHVVCLVAGVSAYLHLGRNEDPEFTVKTMVVQTLWPGATQEETMQQVTDRIEKKLQDTPNLYYLKSYTVAGTSTVFVYLLESTPKKDVPDLWYQVRKKVGDIRQTLPQGVVGPFFNDEFGDTYGIIYGFTADGFSHRELRDYAEEARSRLLRVKDVSKAEFLGTQDERIYVEFSTHRLAELGMDRMELVQALVTQNAVVPSGVIQTKNEAVLMDVTGRFESEKDLQQVNFVFGGKMLRLGDIATITRGYADPPQPKFRVNGKDAIGVALSMRTGGDILALEKNLRSRDRGTQSGLARRHRDFPGLQSAEGGGRSGQRIHEGAVGGHRDRSRHQLPESGPAGGPGRGDLDPAGAGHRVRRHADLRDRLAAHLAGGADHRAGAARR